jgi:hypothetical protein
LFLHVEEETSMDIVRLNAAALSMGNNVFEVPAEQRIRTVGGEPLAVRVE